MHEPAVDTTPSGSLRIPSINVRTILLGLAATAGLTVQIVTAQGSSSKLATIATAAALKDASAPVRAGIVRMQGDPEGPSVQGGAAVGNMTYHGGPVQHIQKIFTIFWGTGS